MIKLFKIILLVLLILLVVMSLVAELPSFTAIAPVLHLALYLRLASLLGLLAAVFMAWGFKRRIEMSHKYRRADQIIAEAQASAQRTVQNAKANAEKLEETHRHRSQSLEERMAALQAEHHQQLTALKKQNMQLKEEVNKLLHVLKKKQAVESGTLEQPAAKAKTS